MDKWSVVIPTLWRSEFLHKQLQEYISSDRVGEIIIIDNSKEYYKHYDELLNKVILIQGSENLYVNPSWNIGVGLSKYENVAIANDDILWDTELLKFISDSALKRFGIIGQVKSNYTNLSLDELKKENPEPLFSKNEKRPNAWGCLLFCKKDYWKNIPEELKIWYGDDWLIHRSGLTTSHISNIKIGGEISASETDEFSDRRMRDRLMYSKILSS